MSLAGGNLVVGGWNLVKNGNIWEARDPKNNKVKFSDEDKGVVYTWAQRNPK